MKNLTIKARLYLLVSLFAFFLLSLTGISFASIVSLSDFSEHISGGVAVPLSYVTKIGESLGNVKSTLFEMSLYSKNQSDIDKYVSESDAQIKSIVEMSEECEKILTEMKTAHDDVFAEQILQNITSVRTDILKYSSDLKTAVTSLKSGDFESFDYMIQNTNAPAINKLLTIISDTSDLYQNSANGIEEESSVLKSKALFILCLVFALAALSIVIVSISIIRSITKPIKNLVNATSRVTNGDLSSSVELEHKGEIGQLSTDFKKLVSVFKELHYDIRDVYSQNVNGVIDKRIDENKYSGAFKDIVLSFNSLIDAVNQDAIDIVEAASKIGLGDFNFEMRKFPGDKIIANKSIDRLKYRISHVTSSIESLASEFENGNLSKRIDIEEFEGGWKNTMSTLNSMIDKIAQPIREAISVLDQLSVGNLKAKLTGNYKGDHAIIKDNLNSTTDSIRSYIDEISLVLSKMSDGDYKVEITREYLGDFGVIKNAINKIIDVQNELFTDLRIASDQVASSAHEISLTSMDLSNGAIHQANAVEDLNSTITQVYEQTLQNEKNSTKAVQLSKESRNNVIEENEAMQHMVKAMQDINNASDDISNIIKVISDIAFQTNILALNAAVEAARAGQYGKGFAVVAEEVRNLAARSQTAANETTALIERSIEKTSYGTKIANQTAESLSKIVGGVESVAHIVAEIEKASKEQAASISKISSGISEISKVTQANSATSQESAAAAQELSSQSAVLKESLLHFETKNIEKEITPEHGSVNNLDEFLFNVDDDLSKESVGLIKPEIEKTDNVIKPAKNPELKQESTVKKIESPKPYDTKTKTPEVKKVINKEASTEASIRETSTDLTKKDPENNKRISTKSNSEKIKKSNTSEPVTSVSEQKPFKFSDNQFKAAPKPPETKDDNIDINIFNDKNYGKY